MEGWRTAGFGGFRSPSNTLWRSWCVMLMLQVHCYPTLNPTADAFRTKGTGSFYFAALSTGMLGNLCGKRNGNRSSQTLWHSLKAGFPCQSPAWTLSCLIMSWAYSVFFSFSGSTNHSLIYLDAYFYETHTKIISLRPFLPCQIWINSTNILKSYCKGNWRETQRLQWG